MGNRLKTTISVPGAAAYGGTTTDTYDYGQTANPLLNRSQVTGEVTTRNGGSTNSFAYDSGIGTGAGNPTSYPGKTFTFNADNQITSTGYGYDGNGNATTLGGMAVTYDAENRLTSYGGTTLSAGYTGDNLRAWKQTSSGSTYFLYDGSSPVCELSSTGAIVTVNTWGGNERVAEHLERERTHCRFRSHESKEPRRMARLLVRSVEVKRGHPARRRVAQEIPRLLRTDFAQQQRGAVVIQPVKDDQRLVVVHRFNRVRDVVRLLIAQRRRQG